MDKEQKLLLEAILMQVGQLNARIEKITADWIEFSERFEDVVTQLEDERRLDLLKDSY